MRLLFTGVMFASAICYMALYLMEDEEVVKQGNLSRAITLMSAAAVITVLD